LIGLPAAGVGVEVTTHAARNDRARTAAGQKLLQRLPCRGVTEGFQLFI